MGIFNGISTALAAHAAAFTFWATLAVIFLPLDAFIDIPINLVIAILELVLSFLYTLVNQGLQILVALLLLPLYLFDALGTLIFEVINSLIIDPLNAILPEISASEVANNNCKRLRVEFLRDVCVDNTSSGGSSSDDGTVLNRLKWNKLSNNSLTTVKLEKVKIDRVDLVGDKSLFVSILETVGIIDEDDNQKTIFDWIRSLLP